MLPSVRDQILRGEYKEASAVLIQQLVAGGATDFLNGLLEGFAMENPERFIQTGGRATFAVKKLTKFIEITDKILAASNLALILADVLNSKPIEEWCIDVKRGEVDLNPDESTAFPGVALPMNVILGETALVPGQSLEYEYSTSGTYGVLRDDIHNGTSFTSSKNEFEYFTTATNDDLTDESYEEVYVEVFIKQGLNRTSIGRDTTELKIEPFEFYMIPNDAVVGGNKKITLRLLQTPRENEIEESEDYDYRIVWDSPENHGVLLGSRSNVNKNSIVYHCLDFDTVEGIENIEIFILRREKGQGEGDFELFAKIEGTINISNDPDAVACTIPITIKSKELEAGENNSCGAGAVIEVGAVIERDPEAEMYELVFRQMRTGTTGFEEDRSTTLTWTNDDVTSEFFDTENSFFCWYFRASTSCNTLGRYVNMYVPQAESITGYATLIVHKKQQGD